MSPVNPLALLALASVASVTLSSPLVLEARELAAAAATSSVAPCATGVHIIVARASEEDAGEGIIGAVASQVIKQLPGSDAEAVPYPATIDNYPSSESEGTGNMTQLVHNYVKRCPNSKIALMGYSQGAQVTLDTLCGTSEGGFTTTGALASQYNKQIVAAIAMGDPSHVVNEPWDVGTSKNNGLFPRQGSACNPFGSIIQSYCDFNDTFCDSGSSLSVHMSYVQTYGNVAANFVVNKVKKA